MIFIVKSEVDYMLIVKSPFRISLFGGSTDYECFYKKYGSFIIGMPIDKYCYITMRYRPRIFSKEYLCTYSKYELVKSIDELQNPLIRETLRYFNVNKPIELFSFSDVPSRTGLGGSSSYCVGMSYLIKKLKNEMIDKNEIIKSAIKIEREILNESGGIQDQIWPFSRGLNSIEINTCGEFDVKPMSITEEFECRIVDSMVLIYTRDQRTDGVVASSYKNNVDEKLEILKIAKEAHQLFLDEDLKNIGKLLYKSWMNKSKISDHVSNLKIKEIIDDVMNMGAYGAKLLGAGGGGFVLALCDPKSKQKIIEKYGEFILNVDIDRTGISTIYQ